MFVSHFVSTHSVQSALAARTHSNTSLPPGTCLYSPLQLRALSWLAGPKGFARTVKKSNRKLGDVIRRHTRKAGSAMGFRKLRTSSSGQCRGGRGRSKLGKKKREPRRDKPATLLLQKLLWRYLRVSPQSQPKACTLTTLKKKKIQKKALIHLLY